MDEQISDSQRADGYPSQGVQLGSAVTINDIARLAGVSKKSVSRVLNDEPGLSEETRERIKAIMKREGYVPSRRARALAGARSYLVAIAYNNRNPSFIVELLQGVQRVATDNGYEVVMHEVRTTGSDMKADIIRFMRRSGCDGLILTPPLSELPELIGAFDQESWGLSRIAGDDFGSHSPQVRYDDRSASLAITRHVIEQGHVRIAFLGGPKESGPTRRRLAGFRDALASNSDAIDDSLLFWGDFTFESGLNEGRKILQADLPPTAIVCANDAMAAGVMHAVREQGLRVPSDVSVTGFDDSQLAVQVWPPLTSVAQPVRAMAEKACDILLATLDGKEAGRVLVEFNHELKLRLSVAQRSQE